MERADDIPTLIDAQRSLRDVRELVCIINLQLLDIFHRGDEMELVRNLSERPNHFGMAGMADQNEIIPLRIVAIDFVMNFDDQWTGGIDHM